MARTPTSQSLHDSIVQRHATTLSKGGHRDIKADHINHVNGAPEEYLSRRPDLTSFDPQGNFIITEVETNDSIGLPDTISQLSTFRSLADYFGGQLHLVVPESGRSEAANIMAVNGISVDVLWHAYGE